MSIERFSVRKRIKSFSYAGKGIYSFLRKEHNAWIHAVVTLLVVLLGVVLDVSLFEWAILALCIGFVFVAEAFNTAIERLVNMVSPEYHKQAGDVKDVAAGAVLIAAIIAAIVGLLVFIPKLLLYL